METQQRSALYIYSIHASNYVCTSLPRNGETLANAAAPRLTNGRPPNVFYYSLMDSHTYIYIHIHHRLAYSLSLSFVLGDCREWRRNSLFPCFAYLDRMLLRLWYYIEVIDSRIKIARFNRITPRSKGGAARRVMLVDMEKSELPIITGVARLLLEKKRKEGSIRRMSCCCCCCCEE